MSDYLNDGEYDTEKTFPEQIQKRIEAGIGCGSSIGKGWLSIIERLDIELAALDPDYKIDQIKEKFGGLRYYISSDSGNNTLMNNCISSAESYASETCEFCGAPGELCKPNSWMHTLCKDCEAKEKKDV